MAKKASSTSSEVKVAEETVMTIPSRITPLSVDYPNEGLNDIARKINEIISHLYAL